MTDSNDEKKGVAAVDRALSILNAFDSDSPTLSLAELAKRTGLYKSTILRLIDSLEKNGYLTKMTDGNYRLGGTTLKLASIYQKSFNLKDIIYPILQKISNETGETSSFYILNNGKRMILFRVEPERTIKVSISEGDEFGLEYGAAGKVLLAFTQDRIELAHIKAQGYASSFGERDSETSSLSVPVFEQGGEVAGALTISGPIERLTQDKIGLFVPLLLEQSRAIGQQLGAVV